MLHRESRGGASCAGAPWQGPGEANCSSALGSKLVHLQGWKGWLKCSKVIGILLDIIWDYLTFLLINKFLLYFFFGIFHSIFKNNKFLDVHGYNTDWSTSPRLATTLSCRTFDPSHPFRECAGFAAISVGGQPWAPKGCESTSERSPRQRKGKGRLSPRK